MWGEGGVEGGWRWRGVGVCRKGWWRGEWGSMKSITVYFLTPFQEGFVPPPTSRDENSSEASAQRPTREIPGWGENELH